MKRAVVAAFALLGTGCLPLVVGPNNFTPAGELGERPYQVGFSAELSRPLTDGTKVASGEVSKKTLWLGEDLSVRLGVTDSLAVEGAIKASTFSPLPFPIPIGGSMGVRYGLLKQADSYVSLDLAGRVVGITTEVKSSGTVLRGSAYGLELQAPVSYRLTKWFAATLTPFSRLHLITATIVDNSTTSASTTRTTGTAWGNGLSLSLELKAGAFAFAPACAIELVRDPTGEVVFSQLEPGLFLGARW